MCAHQSKLRKLWQRWTKTMDTIVKNTRRADRMSAGNYQTLHAELTATMDLALAETSTKDYERKLLRKMLEECEPWVSLEAIASAERHVLFQVVRRSHELSVQLFGVDWLRPMLKVGIPLLLMSAVGIGLGWYVDTSGSLTGTKLSYVLRGMSFRAVYALQRFSLLEWLVGLIAFVCVWGVWLLRSTKKY